MRKLYLAVGAAVLALAGLIFAAYLLLSGGDTSTSQLEAQRTQAARLSAGTAEERGNRLQAAVNAQNVRGPVPPAPAVPVKPQNSGVNLTEAAPAKPALPVHPASPAAPAPPSAIPDVMVESAPGKTGETPQAVKIPAAPAPSSGEPLPAISPINLPPAPPGRDTADSPAVKALIDVIGETAATVTKLGNGVPHRELTGTPAPATADAAGKGDEPR